MRRDGQGTPADSDDLGALAAVQVVTGPPGRVPATTDAPEVSLRRISAYIRESRTGDREAARAMLAYRPPGSSRVIAPGWLLTEFMEVSRTEASTRERVGRGRGREGRGVGRTHGQQWVGAAEIDPPGAGGGGVETID